MESRPRQDTGTLEEFLRSMGRGFGGALIFSLPMLMTMEMWWLGFYMDRLRLVLLLVLNLPLLVVLSYHAGFEETACWRDDWRDAAIAYGIGLIASAIILSTLAILGPGMSLDELVGKIAVQTVPASIGALLAVSQLGGGTPEPRSSRNVTYGGELFLMSIGAIFLCLNLAPTEEMIQISYKMTNWHALALMCGSILVMHGFVYAVGFKGGSPHDHTTPWWSTFLRFTVVGYALAVLISIYILWTFGRTDDTGSFQILMAVTVLAFPAAIGAAAARLIL